MTDLYDEEALSELEEEEHSLTEEALAIMFLFLLSIREKLEHELRAFYQQYGSDGIVTYAEARKYVDAKDHRRRLAVLLLLLHSRFNDMRNGLGDPFDKMVHEVIRKEAEFFNVDLTEELSLKWGTDGKDWRQRLDADIATWEARLALDLKLGFVQQKDLDEVLEQLHDRFSTMETVLTALAITETTGIGSLARLAIMKELGIGQYRFYSRPDERRCEVCGDMHGRVFSMSEYEPGVTASPMHPRCRCWEVPIRE